MKDLVESYQRYLQYCVGYRIIILPCIKRTLSREENAYNQPRLILKDKSNRSSSEQVYRRIQGQMSNCVIGSGSDTRAFQIFKSHANVIYHEIDFPESAKVKKLAILQNPVIRELVGTNETLPL